MESELSLTDKPVDWINKLVARDVAYRDLPDLLDYGASGTSRITASGTREIDYPPVQFHAGGEVEVYKSFSLPPDLIEKFTRMQRNCLMGIFTQCERAWVAIDNELFMWNYEDGEDLAYYDGIQDTIISVGLATPSQGVLPKSITYLLCIATPLELTVLGMTYSSSCGLADSPDSRESALLQVIPDPLYCISTDNYSVSCIEATDHGRIFLGTKEGFLLEFCYGRIPGWEVESNRLPNTTVGSCRGPCSLVNHSASTLSLLLPSILTAGFRSTDPIVQIAMDPIRGLLYTRTEESNITVFSYSAGPDGSKTNTNTTTPHSSSFTRLTSVSGSEVTSAAASVVRSVDRCQFKSLVFIAPLSTGSHHLMAVTRTGIRLYFDGQLHLLHVRLPPTSPYGTVGLGDVKLVAETRGTVVILCALPQPTISGTPNSGTSNWFRQQTNVRTPNSSPVVLDDHPLPRTTTPPNVIYTISPDPFPWTPNLTEVCSSSWCVPGAWALAVLPPPPYWADEKVEQNQLLLEDETVMRHQPAKSLHNGATTDFASSSSTTIDTSTKLGTSTARGRPPVVLTQHLDAPFRRLLLISAHGLVHLRLPSPLYRLKEFITNRKQVNLTVPSMETVNSSIIGGTPRRQFSACNLDELCSAAGDQTSFTMLDSSRFLTLFLHQFSPDEAICAALTLGAAHAMTESGFSEPNSIENTVEQIVLFFAAEAAQNWTPAVRFWSDSITAGGQTLMGSQVSTKRSLHNWANTCPTESVSSGSSSSIFLFTGLCVFLARVSRAFWRAPLFRDASMVLANLSESSAVSEKSIGSWVRTLVSVLASAASAASPLRNRSDPSRAEENVKPLICRLESHQIAWLWHQLAYVQRFLRRQLQVQGGWLRADHDHAFLATQSGKTAEPGSSTGTASSLSIVLQRLTEDMDCFISLMLEVLGFWRILSDHGLEVHRIVKRLTSEQNHLLLHLPFESYLTDLYSNQFGQGRSTNACFQMTPSRGVGLLSSPAPSVTSKGGSNPSGAGISSRPPAVDLLTSLINALIDHYLTRQEEDEQQRQQLAAVGIAGVNSSVTATVGNGSVFGKTVSSVSLSGITSRLQTACPTLFAHEDAISAKASECLVQATLLNSKLITSGYPLSSTNLSGPVFSDEAILDEIDHLLATAVKLYAEAGPWLDLNTAVHRLITAGAWRGSVALCLHVAAARDPTDIAVECLKHGRRPSAEKAVMIGSVTDKRTPGTASVKSANVGADLSRRNYYQTELAVTEGRYDAYYQMTLCLEQLWELCQMPPATVDNLFADDFDQTRASTLLVPPPIAKSDTPSSRRLIETCLSPSSARDLLQDILQEVVIASNDILAHFEVVNWLLLRGLSETAISLNSPYLEDYIRSRLRQVPDDPDLRCLLWRQLERRGARLEAAKVLEHLAVNPCSRLTLEDRLNFAARAIVAIKSLPPSQQDADYLHDMESRLELAQLQQQLHSELSLRLSGSPGGSNSPRCQYPFSRRQLEEAVHQLSHGPLLSPTEMFTQYADKFELHESKLYLLWTSGSQDSTLIKAIWRDLLRNLLSSTPSSRTRLRRSPPATPRSSLSPSSEPQYANSPRNHSRSSNQHLIDLSLVDCLSRLGYRFCSDTTTASLSPQAQVFFPLAEIVATLEYFAIQQSLPTSWVPLLLRDIRLPCVTAYVSDAYDALLHSKEAFWRLPEVHSRLLAAFVTVSEEFLSTVATQLPARVRLAQTSRLLDRVTSILVDLNSSELVVPGDSEALKKQKAVKQVLQSTVADSQSLSTLPNVVVRLRRVHDQLQRYC